MTVCICRYLKSILANSADISRLIRSVHENTGMSVSTSLDDSLTLKRSPVCKRELPHPWDEHNSVVSGSSSAEQVPDEDNIDMLLDDDVLRHPENLLNESSDILPLADTDYDLPFSEEKETGVVDDHSYTNEDKNAEDVGVCLHVSNHRVSLEFCPSCSENAATNWQKVDGDRW